MTSGRGQWNYGRCCSAWPSVATGDGSIHREKVHGDWEQPVASDLSPFASEFLAVWSPRPGNDLQYIRAADPLHSEGSESTDS